MSETAEETRYAIIWARGEHIYTHSNRNDETITYSRAELDDVTGLTTDNIVDDLSTLLIVKAQPVTLFAVPDEILRWLLGQY